MVQIINGGREYQVAVPYLSAAISRVSSVGGLTVTALERFVYTHQPRVWWSGFDFRDILLKVIFRAVQNQNKTTLKDAVQEFSNRFALSDLARFEQDLVKVFDEAIEQARFMDGKYVNMKWLQLEMESELVEPKEKQ